MERGFDSRDWRMRPEFIYLPTGTYVGTKLSPTWIYGKTMGTVFIAVYLARMLAIFPKGKAGMGLMSLVHTVFLRIKVWFNYFANMTLGLKNAQFWWIIFKNRKSVGFLNFEVVMVLLSKLFFALKIQRRKMQF